MYVLQKERAVVKLLLVEGERRSKGDADASAGCTCPECVVPASPSSAESKKSALSLSTFPLAAAKAMQPLTTGPSGHKEIHLQETLLLTSINPQGCT